MRPQYSSAYLDLPSAPITTRSQESSWQAFTDEESKACEAAWQALSDDEKVIEEDIITPLPSSKEKEKEGDLEDGQEEEDTVGVSIAMDKLFEVNVRKMRVLIIIL